MIYEMSNNNLSFILKTLLDSSKKTAEKKGGSEDCAVKEKKTPSEIFSEKIALKTAKIISIEKHPDADKLYIEKLDDGSGIERTILSGLVPFLKEEELLGKTDIIADNLKPRKMRGIESRGMLLAASRFDADGKE